MRLIDADVLINKLTTSIYYGQLHDCGADGIEELKAVLADVRNMPTVKPEWIPTRDRKPTKAGQYLVTKQQKTGELQRATAHYNPSFDEWSGNGNFGKVLAWMELPPVYKEDADD